MKSHLILTLAAAASFVCRPVAAQNPIIDQGSADPSVKVFGGRAYIYGTHDFSPGNATWIAKDWHVFSSSDLVTWNDAGVVLDDDSLAWRGASDRNWAPDAIFFANQYYFYFSLGDDKRGVADMIGVAAARSPTGPFTDILGKPLVDRSTSAARGIDPMAFEDTDGARYLIWGNGSPYIAELNDDMKSFKTPPQKVAISGAPSYEEGPFVWTHGGRYYLLYSRCGAGCSDSLDYAVGTSVRGPYAYRGTIVAHGKRGNEHGSVFEFNGQWYVAYHDLFPTDYYRKTKLEFVHYTNRGDIPQVYPTDYGVGRHERGRKIEAENYFAKSSGISYEDCSDVGDGFAVVGATNESWLKFQKVDLGEGTASFKARVSAGPGPARLEVRLGSVTGTLIGACDVPAGDPTWRTLETKLSDTIAGVNDVVLVFKGGAQSLFKLNWLEFAQPDGAGAKPRQDRAGGCRAGGCTVVSNDGSPAAEALGSLLALTATLFRRRRRGTLPS